ncbi:MAG TPA: hydroxyacid dehydrogenase, partial [Rhodospirillales bacterium]|nr:hydroxyacid dehydrogenase [Rhodospirillales bacterium]
NIHFNLSQPTDMEGEAFLAKRHDINRQIHDLVMTMDGSFSAEHGIGVLKRDDLARYKSGVEIDLMRQLKQTLDPDNLLNPGKVL